jgi:PAS domain S-box-containing protein
LAREPLADAFFGFPDTEEADLGFANDVLDLLEYPAFVVDKHLNIVVANLQGRDTQAWAASLRPGPSHDDLKVLPPGLREIVASHSRRRVHRVIKDVAVVEDPPFLFDVFLSRGHIRGETYTFVVLMTASAVEKPRRGPVLSRLLNGFSGGSFVADSEAKFVALNDAFLDAVGYSAEEITGHHPNDFNKSEQALAYGRIFKNLISSPQILRSPTVTYSTMRRGPFVSPVTAWTITDKHGRGIGLAVIGGFHSRPRTETARIERRHVLLEKAADLMSEAIFITDLDGRILVKNPAADSLLTGGDERALNIKTDVPWEIPETIESVFSGLAQGREQPLFNTGVITPSHKAILKIRVFALKRVSDVIQEVVFVCGDISQQEYLKQTLFQTTRRLSDDKALRDKVLQNIDIPFAVLGEDMTVLDANDATCRKFGFTRAEVVGSRLSDLNPNLESSGFLDIARSAIRTGEISRYPDFAHITRGGKSLNLALAFIPVELSGRRVCIAIAESETDPELGDLAAEVALRARIGDAVIGYVSEGVFVISRDGTFLEANEGAVKGSAMPREQIIGCNVKDLIALSDEEDLFTGIWENILATEEPYRTGLVKSRSRVHNMEQFVDCIAHPIRDGKGRIERILVIVHYLREIKSLEQQVEEYTSSLETTVAGKTRELSDSNALLASMAERVKRTARSGSMMASLRDRQAVLDAFLKQAKDVLGCDYVTLFMRDGDASPPSVKQHSIGPEPGKDRHTREAIDGALADVMLNSGAAERVWTPLDHLLLAKFFSGNQRGVFAGVKTGSRFTSVDVDLAHLLCSQLSNALPAAKYVAEQRTERERAECLRRIAFRIAGLTSLKDAVRTVAEEISKVVALDGCFWLVNEGRGRLWVSEIFRRVGTPAQEAVHVDLETDVGGDPFAGVGREVRCERFSGNEAAVGGECGLVVRAEDGGIARTLCDKLVQSGLVEVETGSCVIFPVHLTPVSRSYLCAHSVTERAFTDDEICFMCLAASAVGRVWLEADSASSLRRLETAGQTVSGLAHDFRYPIGKVADLLKRLASGGLDAAEATESARSALVDVEHLFALTAEFIDMARSGGSRPEFTDILQVLEDSLALAGDDLRRKRVNIERRYDRAAPLPPIFVSRTDLSRVFINLIANGLDAVDEEGWIGVSAYVEGAAGERPRVVVAFENSGPPVPAEVKDTLFSPFKSTKPGGTGLGLFSSKRRANANAGDVVFEETEGGGAVFKVWFPAAFE